MVWEVRRHPWLPGSDRLGADEADQVCIISRMPTTLANLLGLWHMGLAEAGHSLSPSPPSWVKGT